MVVEFMIENAIIGIAIISALISFSIAVVYRFMIDQNEMRSNKEEVKKIQAEMKKLMKSGKQKEATALQKKMMMINSKNMRATMKPMLLTIIFVIPIFLFVFPNLYGIDPISLENGIGQFEYQGQIYDIEYTINDAGAIMDKGDYKFEYGRYDSKRSELQIRRVVAESPINIPFAGQEIGWLGWYILVSIPFSFISRKILGVV